MASRPAQAVDDWQAVQADDWQTVEEKPWRERNPKTAAVVGAVSDVGNAAAQAPIDLLKGVGAGVISTGTGIYNLARKAIPALPEPNEAVRRAGRAPDSIAGAIGKGAEQAAEFFLPGGMVSRGAKAVSAATQGMRGAKVVSPLARALMEGTSAGAVTAAQTGDPESGINAGLLTTGVTAALPVVGNMIPERLKPKGMYQSSLRPSLSQKNLPKIDKEVETGLREGIPVDRRGLAKVDSTIDSINGDITTQLRDKSDQLGPVIGPKDVARRVEDVRPTFGEQVNPNADLNSLSSSKAEFLNKHSYEAPYTKIRPGTDEAAGSMVPMGSGATRMETPLTLAEAQAEKQGTYRQLRKKYGELGSAEVEAQKNLARGLKEEIVKRVPELSKLNEREGALIELQTQLERMVAREGNKNLLGLVPSVMSHNPYGFIATLAMDNPAIKSRIAIALDRAGTLGMSAPGVARLGNAIAGGLRTQQPDSTPGRIIGRGDNR